jgi:hypothetical protein
MIDLETLGLHANCVVLSIAAYAFDLETGDKDFRFRKNLKLESQLKAGRTINAETLQWWLTQDRKTFEGCLTNQIEFEQALWDLGEYIDNYKLEYVWANGIAFDLGILRHAYNSVGIPLPWKYYNERDYKTIRELLADPDTGDDLRRIEHDPLDDCRYQIDKLCSRWKHFTKLNYGTTAKEKF